MEQRVKEIFDLFLIPMFNYVLADEYNNTKDEKDEKLVQSTVGAFFVNYIENLPNPLNTQLGLITDKYTDEYMSIV